jgi:maltodextrin utilization protein YvdJ
VFQIGKIGTFASRQQSVVTVSVDWKEMMMMLLMLLMILMMMMMLLLLLLMMSIPCFRFFLLYSNHQSITTTVNFTPEVAEMCRAVILRHGAALKTLQLTGMP